jgi:hypothetical protein
MYGVFSNWSDYGKRTVIMQPQDTVCNNTMYYKDTIDVSNAINVPIKNDPPKTPIKTPIADNKEVNLNAPLLEE